MAITDPLIGQKLANYRIERPLGRGGMAQVYFGRDVGLERPVAIKVIDTRHRQKQEYARRFVQEARVIANWRHAHIVQILYAGNEEGLYYFVMEYIEGQDLGQLLHDTHGQGQLLPLADVLRIIRAVTSALDYAHERGIIHRDVKPSNVMMAADGRIVLTDFGLAMHVDHGTSGEAFGSPRYMAPEQAISSSSAVAQSDLYAVGVMLYEMLTGRLPFDAADPLNLAMRHMESPPPPPRRIRPDLPAAVEGVVLQALAKDPAQRFASGHDLAAALAAALPEAEEALTAAAVRPDEPLPETDSSDTASTASQAVRPLPPIPAAVVVGEAAPPSATAPPTKPRQRSCLRTLLLMATAVLLAAGIVGGWFWQQQGGNLQQAVALLGLGAATITPSPTATATETAAATTTTTATATQLPTATKIATSSPSPTVATAPQPATATSNPPTATLSPVTAATTAMPTPTATAVITNVRASDDMPQVLIQATTFTMGLPAGEATDEDESPPYEVSVDAFFIDQYEVSVAQYAVFLNEIGQYVNACRGFTCLSTAAETQYSHLLGIVGGDFVAEEGFEDYPVNGVSWYGAWAYCDWVGGRLPTEAEWEAAARGVNGRVYPWGDEPPDIDRAVFGGDFVNLQPVDALPRGATPLDVYGMAGGVWEWVGDMYAADAYSSNASDNPTGPPGSTYGDRVLRGGGFRSDPVDLRTANRHFEDATIFRNIDDVGFRCVNPER